MKIQNRLAKLEGINKSRSEKLIQAKAKAKQLFGVDDAKSLKSLWEKVSSLKYASLKLKIKCAYPKLKFS
jgi:hypothetical protein